MLKSVLRPGRSKLHFSKISRRWQSNVPSERKSEGVARKNEYVPKNIQPRVTYEYPPPPEIEPMKPVEASAFRKHFPILAAVGGIAWAAYAYKHFISDDSESEEQTHLAADHFTTFKLTYKHEITPELALIEISPKYETFQRMIRQRGGLWNGKKLWSIDIKQPEIQVARKYTPLPLYFQRYYDGKEQKALLRMIGKGEDEGRMVLLVKKYNDGEVSRYLHKLEVGSEVDIRGPFVGYKFPYAPIDSTDPRDPMEDLPSRMLPEYAHPDGIPLPDNIAFFAAGTGIAPILQSLLSYNPPRGKVDVFYSLRDRSEIPISRFLLFLEKAGRAKFHYFIDNEGSYIKESDVPSPVAKQYSKNADPKLDEEIKHDLKLRKVMEEIRREKYGIEPLENEQKLEHIPEPRELENQPQNVSSNSLKADDVGPRRKYRSVLEQVAEAAPDQRGPAIAVVCGPEGYIRYAAGARGMTNKEPIGGLLGEKGWTNENAFRMES